MKRPLAGLLASVAAAPGAWLLAGSERGLAPSPSSEPPSADEPQHSVSPAQRLAAVAPAFGDDSVTPAPQIAAGPAPEAVQRAGPTDYVAAQTSLATIVAVELPDIALSEPLAENVGPAITFAERPVIQPLYESLPQPKLAESPAQPPTQASTPKLAILAEAAPAKSAEQAPAEPKFVARPIVQPLPLAVAAQVEAPSPPRKVKRPAHALVTPVAEPQPVLLAQAVSSKPASPPKTQPPFVAKPVVQPLPVAVAAVVPPASTAPVAAVPKPQLAAPNLAQKPVQTGKRVAAPIAEPKLAAAVPAPKQPARASTPKPVQTGALPQPAPRLARSSAPNLPTDTAKAAPIASPAEVRVPEAKLPVGQVVLASFSPAAAPSPTLAPAPMVPAKARNAMGESTAAKTVPIGAPERVTYPEPAFGPPEAKFIPAALSTVESPEQPTSLGAASTLGQAIAYSYETNPRLLAERASTRAADLGFPAARAAFGPRLDASASLSYTRDRDEILPGSFLRQQGWSDTASLILSQPLLTFGRSQARVGQAAANIDFRRESLRLVQNEVMLDVIGAYVGTLREAGAVTIARENVALLQRQLEESNARFAVREITLADVQQVETRLSLGKTVLLEAQARLGEIHARFYRAVGMPPGELAPPEPLTLPVSSLPEAYSLADNQSPLVRAAQARERISRAFLAGIRAEAAPRVDFRGSADYGAMSDYSRDLHGTRVRGTVTLSVPLFDSGARLAESGQAREANSADMQLIAAAQRDSRTAVATGWNNVLAARLSIDHYRQAVESAQRAYENAQRQERAGMRTTLDVLDLARDLLNVRNAYNAALADEYQARATLLATLGQLDPDKMSDGIKLYDPADHFRKVKGKGDIPLLTGSLAALDGVVLPNLKANKPSTDAAAMVGTAETVTGK